MKKRMTQAIAVASVALFVWACGGKTVGVGNGNADSGATGDDVNPGDDNNGDDVGIDSGFVNEGGCNGFGCLDASTTCPATPPNEGTFCPTDGVECTFGTSCGPEFICRNNTWGIVIRTCPPPPTCPLSPPSGSCNGEVGISCSWGSGCNMETCDCVATPGGAIWECSGTACVDAGHTGDSGH
jgi:hypothetical protein